MHILLTIKIFQPGGSMLLVIGTEHCSRCNMAKGLLDRKGIEYEYKLLSSLSIEEQNKYIQIAKQSNQMSMPLIIKDGKIIALQEV